MNPIIQDSRFRVEVLAKTPAPQLLVFNALHQDYCENYVFDQADNFYMSETQAGNIAVKRLLANKRGHYGCLEHPAITFATGFFPHSVMVQARTHRVGVSFDVQSMRYTGDRVIRAWKGQIDFDDVFYLRPPGEYRDRKGNHYEYTESDRARDRACCLATAQRYAELVEDRGVAPEQARGVLSSDYRQHFVVSFSLRAVLHFMDLRAKADAQPEILTLAMKMWPHVTAWVPEIAFWYENERLGRALLSP